MSPLRRLLSRKALIPLTLLVVLGLSLLHPYPRQSLFGPTLRGKPRCVWEAEVRRNVNPDANERSLTAKLSRWLGVAPANMKDAELFDHASMLPLLLELSKDPDPVVRRGVVSQFIWWEKLQHASAAPDLRLRLDDVDPLCRIDAVMALAAIEPHEKRHDVVTKILDDPVSDSGLRNGAMHALKYLSDFDALARYARDPDPRIRTEVMFTLHRFGKKALPILLQGVDDPDAVVRCDAMDSLVRLGPDAKEAVPILERRLNDTNKSVRGLAAEALKAIDPERFGHLQAEK